MNHRSKPFSMGIFRALACIAACLPLILGGAGSLVLCFGHGGHIAIEPVHDYLHHSHDDHRDEHSGDYHMVLSHEDCNSCFDIPLTVEEADQLLFDKDARRIASLFACDPAQSSPIAAIRTDGNFSGSAHPSHFPLPNSLEALRTTVLRT
jgi:hypothetical protein